MQQIFDLVWNSFAHILTAILPASRGFPAEVQAGLTQLISYTNVWGIVIPWQTVWQIIRIIFYFESAILAFNFVKLLISWCTRILGPIGGAAVAGTIAFSGALVWVASLFQ